MPAMTAKCLYRACATTKNAPFVPNETKARLSFPVSRVAASLLAARAGAETLSCSSHPPNGRPNCQDLAQTQAREQSEGLSGTPELAIAKMATETHYRCRAGDQNSCQLEAQQKEEERVAETQAQMEAQTRAQRSAARVAWAQFDALQQANRQRWEASQGIPVLP